MQQTIKNVKGGSLTKIRCHKTDSEEIRGTSSKGSKEGKIAQIAGKEAKT